MKNHRPRTRALSHGLLSVAMFVSALAVLQFGTSSPASADVPPILDTPAGHVTADVLPTVQINGVVWDQAIVGNTVYAVGEFTRARPAGSPPGVNEVVRNNMLAYNLTTGVLLPNFAPSLNAQAKTVTASPDGSRIYIGGMFTQIGTTTKNRIAALNPTTGAVITTFNAQVDYRVNDIVATNTTVYGAGQFNYGNANAVRTRIAAWSATTGALTTWAPSADNEVHAIMLSPDGTRAFVGGKFQNVNGQPAYGLAALDINTGALIPSWGQNTGVRNAQANAAVLSIKTDGTSIFGSGYTFSRATGNLEGVWSADPVTGNLNFVEDCHGDTYDHAEANGFVYTVSHIHYCGNVGGFPQSDPWTINQQHVASFTNGARGTASREPWGYHNWEGKPAPAMMGWFPELEIGDYTGQSQAAWDIEANSQYVVIGGEFPRVNNTSQQGLARFAVKPIAPANQGPRLGGDTFPINVQSKAANQVRISFPANWDRDDTSLTYRITRNGGTIFTTTRESTFWDRQNIGFTDTGLTAGQSYTYRVFVEDGDGNSAVSNNFPVTVTGSGGASPYSNAVMADGAKFHWRFDTDNAGFTPDEIGFETAVRDPNASIGASGAILNEGVDTSASFNNNANSRIYTPTLIPTDDPTTVEAWVRTSSTTGGRIFGIGNSGTGTSNQTDRLLYMANDGRIFFGARQTNAGPGPSSGTTRQTVNSQAGFNNGQWHHIVGTLGDNGMNLFVDGVGVASRNDVKQGAAYYGYWRVGADSLSNWASRPTTDRLTGDIDEVAVYNKVLTPTQVGGHYVASGRALTGNLAPSASFTTSTTNMFVAVNGSASTDADGTIVSYAWNFGDGGTATGPTADHTYLTSGNKTITLTVTDDDGSTGSTTRIVSVSPAPVNQPPTAAFSLSASGLAVTATNNGSSDSDGTITNYAWNFGDGFTTTGQTASHTYAAAGTYSVTLTVTDDDGADGSSSQSVTVSAVTVYAADTFGRTTPSGFGAADTGGNWTVAGTSANFSVSGGLGRIALPTAAIARAATLTGVSGLNVESTVDLAIDKPMTGGGVFFGATLRKVGNTEYRLRVRATPTATALQLMTVVNNVETVISTASLPGVLYSAGSTAHVRFRAIGSGTTALAGKVWFDGAAEPAAFQIQANDSTAALQAPGGVGVHVYVAGSVTNAPLAMTVDNLQVLSV